ncbi:MAG: LON peptidase substrate-binding domain-containing protein, partial [Dethiobacteria bacterium]
MNANELPVLPLRGVIVFPNMVVHLDVGREGSINALDEAMLRDSKILLVAQKKAQIDVPEPGDLYRVGTVVNIKQVLKLPGGTLRVLVEGLNRARIKDILQTEPFYKATYEELEE